MGPRIALGILSGASVDEFHRCVEAQDAASLIEWSRALDDTSGWVRKDGKIAGRSVTAK